MRERRLKSWLDGFEKFTEKTDSPKLFRRWTGLFTIAAALERKIWVRTVKGVLYPNVYSILVGPPGAGKGVILAHARQFLSELQDHHLAPSSVTRASLIDSLDAAQRQVMLPKAIDILHFNSLAVVSTEFGVFLPAYENDFMNTLTDIYDGVIYSETRRTKDIQIELRHPQLNLLAGTTPSYLNNLLPEGAWDQGFMSRTVPIYAGAGMPGDLFTMNGIDTELEKLLIQDIKTIGDLVGLVTFEEDAAQFVIDWHKQSPQGGEPIPDHPRLAHYGTRRTAHLLKLCMIISASNGNSLKVTMEDAVEAFDTLTEAEHYMPDIFKAMRNGGDATVIDETWHHVYKIHMKEQFAPVAEPRVIAFLAERTPAHNVIRILDVMTRTGMLRKEVVDHVGSAYIPKPRR